MQRQRLVGRTLCGLLPAFLFLTLSVTRSEAQILATPIGAGVIVDPNGVLRTEVYQDSTGQVMRQRVQSAKAALPGDLAKGSKLRKISLHRLEKAIEAQLANDRKPT